MKTAPRSRGTETFLGLFCFVFALRISVRVEESSPEINIDCFPQSLSTLFWRYDLSLDLGASQFTLVGWIESPASFFLSSSLQHWLELSTGVTYT